MEQRRKAMFKAALALAGMTAQEFARQRGVTANHISLVLRGLRQSERLLREIDAFIDMQTKQVA